jgi:hypothetical protein
MACFNLTSCLDGSVIITNTDLTIYVGLTITIAEEPGQCYVVTGNQDPDCIGGIPVTFVSQYDTCLLCSPPEPDPCNCPQGTVLVTLPDGTQACRQDTVVLAQGPLMPIGCQKIAKGILTTPQGPGVFGRSADYCKLGATFYPECSGKPWPIQFNSACTPGTQTWTDFSLATVPPIANTSNSLWGTGSPAFDGRFNVAGVDLDPTNPCGGGGIAGGYYGFTFCLNVATPTTYCFGFGGLGIEILINGAQFLISNRRDNYQYEKWEVVQLTLPAGSYIIQMSGESGTGINTCGQNTFPTSVPFTNPGFAFEIYQATAAALAAMTTTVQLNAVLVYSTMNEAGQKMDYGTSVYNYRCPCDPPPTVCPSSHGQFNLIKPVLDNCTANPLNPNANPDIYVCHTYTYTPISQCCYILTDCENPSITHLTSTNLGSYIGQVITVVEYVGCFIVSLAQGCDGSETPVTFIQSFGSALPPENGCEACKPKCYMLEDCAGVIPAFIVSTNLSAYVGQIVQLCPGLGGPVDPITECGCFIVSLAGGCQGAIPLPGVIINNYETCEDCIPNCYQLTNCEDSSEVIITNTNLSAYLTQVIFIDGCPGTCWIVSTADTCTGAVPVVVDETFADCDTCLGIPPPPPLELRPRKIKPGYDTPGCDPAYTEKVYCNFGNAVYDAMLIKRYGITMCCNQPIEKWSIKKQLLDLRALYDPELCENTFCKCPPPCALVVELVVYNPLTCDPPTDIEAEIEVPADDCPAPVNMEAAISIP